MAYSFVCGRGDAGPRRRVFAFAGSAKIDRDAGEMLELLRHLKRVTSVIGGEIGDQDVGLTCALLFIIEGEIVDFDLGHQFLRTEQIRMRPVARSSPSIDGSNVKLARMSGR